MTGRCILGVNKYSQSTSIALVDEGGEALFALARERLTRKKFDGGDIAELLRCALAHTGLTLRDIALVVENCHLFRIGEFEPRLPFTVGQHYYPASYLDEYNLADARCPVPKVEITHHMAHAYGALYAAPFDEGLVVIMDGMGSLRSDVAAKAAPAYMTECAAVKNARGFIECPARPDPARGWREAESAYLFRGAALQRVFKRWSPLRSPELLYNYGFENMESLGAVYSRVSSHIFKDWNACGKVMGLAAYGRPDPARPLMTGPLESLSVNWEYLDRLPTAESWDDPATTGLNKTLAATAQANLEQIALDFLRGLRKRTGERNLILSGGVALNSQMNALIAAEAGFERVYVPSAPGDDGTALGCAAFGLLKVLGAKRRPRLRPLSPYLGPAYDRARIRQALDAETRRILVEEPADLPDRTARLLAGGKVVGWFQGRSEFGPRALGNRSILAHPGLPGMAEHLNVRVKRREVFRPYAPSVLAREAGRMFRETSPSVYMSFAVPVRPPCRLAIPSAVHVDGTARIQRVEQEMNPLFHALIRRFRDVTGLPCVLNTSFNDKGEAIVETPEDALWTFLNTEMDALVLGPFLVTKRRFPAGRQRDKARVRANAEALIETVRQPGGELHRATAYYRGRGMELSELQLAILDMAGVPAPLGDILRHARREGISRREVLAATRDLFAKGLIFIAA